MKWQPIETAPIGVEVLVVDAGIVSVARKDSRRGEWFAMADGQHVWVGSSDRGGLLELLPSHWMPLPANPVDTGTETG